jgi:parallel beta-helix repeat protein
VPGQVSQGVGWHYDSRGWVEIDGDGAVFTGYRLTTDIAVNASNVTIRNNYMTQSGGWGIALRHADNVTIDSNTIRGTLPHIDSCDDAIRDIYGDSDNVKITRNNIYYCSSGINHFNSGGLIEDNYIHDLGYPCNGSACDHFNGIQLGAGTGSKMTINHNTIFNPYSQTDAIMLANDDGPQTNRTITNNLLAGGGYSFYGSGGPDGQATNIIFTGNRFSTRYYPNSGYWGPVAHWKASSGNVWTNNTWIDGPKAGLPVDL